jgi:hypothetical protein
MVSVFRETAVFNEYRSQIPRACLGGSILLFKHRDCEASRNPLHVEEKTSL